MGGEVLGRVVDDTVGAKARHERNVLASTHGGDGGSKTLRQLQRCGADGAGRPIDEDIAADIDVGRSDGCECVVRTFRAGGGLLEGQARNGRDRAVLGDGHVLSVRTEAALVVSKDPITRSERGDAVTDRFDNARELRPEHRDPWPEQPGEEANDERLPRSITTVGAVHRRRVNPHEQLA